MSNNPAEYKNREYMVKMRQLSKQLALIWKADSVRDQGDWSCVIDFRFYSVVITRKTYGGSIDKAQISCHVGENLRRILHHADWPKSNEISVSLRRDLSRIVSDIARRFEPIRAEYEQKVNELAERKAASVKALNEQCERVRELLPGATIEKPRHQEHHPSPSRYEWSYSVHVDGQRVRASGLVYPERITLDRCDMPIELFAHLMQKVID